MDSLPWRSKPQDERQSAFAEFLPETPVSTSDQSISQASNDASQKLTRHSTSKVRTGCVTCKKRHVKCDETKPFCTNCLKLKGHCEGYVIKPRKKRAKPAPKSEDAAKQLTRQSSASTSPPTRLVDPDANVGFSDNLSIMYFDEFVYLVGLSLGGTSAYHNLWRATLPQLSRTNETLRHAAIAIGALSRAHSYDHGNTLSIPRDRTAVMRLREESPHYHNAIVHYCRALRLQIQATSSASVAQTTVLLSILFICFEIIRGDRHSAIQHLNHGMTLLHAVLSSELGAPEISSIAPNPRSLIADVIDTYTMLATQSRIVLDGQVGSSLPLPGLSKDLSDKGQTLDSFFLTMQAFGSQSTVDADSLPATFTSLDEAESYWMGLQRWGLNIGMVYLDIMMKNSLWELEDDDEIDAVLESVMQQPQLHEITDQYMRMINAWEATFRTLFNKVIMDGETDRHTYIGAINLRLQYVLTSTFSCIPRFGDHDAIEGLSAQFREMNSLCELMLRTAQKDYTSPAHHVSLDGGVTWALGLIAVHCRDPLVREDAVRLLSEYPRRDGLWDSAAFRAVGVRNRALERANATEGTPQEQWRRMWRREFIFEDAGSRVRFRFMEKDPETGKWRPVEEVGELRQGTDEVQWRRQPFLTGKGKFIAGNIMPMPPRPESTDKAEPDTPQT